MLWLRLAVRFIRRHRRKSLATGSFIFTGASILVLIHSITVGISVTMILNTTSLHYGEAFTEVRPGGEAPETLASEMEAKGLAETALVRYRFVSIIKKGNALAPSISFPVQPTKESEKTAISKRIIRGRYPSGREILLGKRAAESLKADVGEGVTVFDGSAVQVATLTVSGVFSTAIDRYDEGISFIPVGVLEKEFLRKQGLWLSPLNVEYRDVRYAIPFLVQFWFFITPVSYSIELIPEKWQTLYALNPMVGVVEGFRWALFGQELTIGPIIIVSAIAVIVILISGLFYFRRMEERVADVV